MCPREIPTLLTLEAQEIVSCMKIGSIFCCYFFPCQWPRFLLSFSHWSLVTSKFHRYLRKIKSFKMIESLEFQSKSGTPSIISFDRVIWRDFFSLEFQVNTNFLMNARGNSSHFGDTHFPRNFLEVMLDPENCIVFLRIFSPDYRISIHDSRIMSSIKENFCASYIKCNILERKEQLLASRL